MRSRSSIPAVPLGADSRPMPRVGFGTAAYPLEPSEAMRSALRRAIETGYRHFDTAAVYQSEQPLGEAIAEALRSGLLGSRADVFVTSKLWCSDAHRGLVRPALQTTLQNLGMDYLDLYLIHFPVSCAPGKCEFPLRKEDLLPIDIHAVWEEMEECQRLGLTKSIGVSNFSCKKLEMLLSKAKLPPAVNQVEVNPLWQQKKLREFCTSKGIQLCAYSPLGASGTAWGTDTVMRCEVLREIAATKEKTLAQVCLRWVYEQGDCVLVKSFNEKRMEENLDILDWELNEEEREKISQIPQRKGCLAHDFVSDDGPYKSLEEFWDGEI